MLNKFDETYGRLNISTTSKVYILLNYVAPYDTVRGLHLDCEQSMVASHQEFQKVWSKYLMRYQNAPAYQKMYISYALCHY